MSFGFYSENTSGYIQIDHDFSNYEITQKGMVSAFSQVSFPGKTDGSNLLFIRQTQFNQPAIEYGTYVGGNTSSLNGPIGNYFQVGMGLGGVGTHPIQPLKYFTASRGGVVSPAYSGDYGLQVNKTNGEVAYDSRREYLKIAAIFYITLGPPSFTYSTQTITLPPPPEGKEYYVCLNGFTQTDLFVYEYDSYTEFLAQGIMISFTSSTSLEVYKRIFYEPDWDFGAMRRLWGQVTNHTVPVLVAVL